MILSVCPNPCIDKAVYIEDFKLGALNRISKKVISLGGKALNVAIAAKRLDYPSYATGFMFDDGAKRHFERLNIEDVPYIFAMCEGEVRVNTKVISLKDKSLTEINEKGNLVSFQKQFELIESIRTLSKSAEVTVFSGSLPQNVDDNFYYRAGQAVASTSKIVVDAEGEILIKSLKLRPALIKPNIYEMQVTTGITIKGISDLIRACDILIKEGARKVLVSMGSSGAVIYDGKDGYTAIAPPVEAKSTVGAGDSMVAAASVAIAQGYCNEALLKSAVAAGTAAVLGEGTDLIQRADYDRIFPLVETHKL